MLGWIRKGMVWGVMAPFLIMTLAVPAAHATAVVTTAQAMAQSGIEQTRSERARIQGFLAREDVVKELVRLGVSPADAQSRVAALTDAEIARIDQHIEQLPAGGNSLIGALVFIFVLLLITDILGLTKVFPFTRSVR